MTIFEVLASLSVVFYVGCLVALHLDQKRCRHPRHEAVEAYFIPLDETGARSAHVLEVTKQRKVYVPSRLASRSGRNADTVPVSFRVVKVDRVAG